ncbi:hypothetical protein FSARC_7002 [Fusarium sarcochroum]|uniref:BTB domain-containing protein n=1 Tax=Fusarium sarcochroum TaxID=1208366 RepID=A0A8H4X8F5_9HYPO|nr:hypothetical protein FSARC_7002 [Fusarium sarcochroum]
MTSKSSSALPDLVESGDYSDFTLTCEGQDFKLHQILVCPKSPVMAKALKGNFREATSRVLRVEQFDVATVRRMIIFIYTGDYSLEPTCKEPNTPSDPPKESSVVISSTKEDDIPTELLCHLRMNSIGDYYDIQGLVEYANAKMQPLLQNSQTESLPQLVQEVSDSTGDTVLHSIVASLVASHIEDVVDLPAFSQIKPRGSIMITILNACASRVRTLEWRNKHLEELSARTRGKKGDGRFTRAGILPQLLCHI